MIRHAILAAAAALATTRAAQAAAAGEYGFFSLRNSDFVVLIGFLVFLGILAYFKVPQRLAAMLDDRAAGIRADLDEAKSIREEAQSLLDRKSVV